MLRFHQNQNIIVLGATNRREDLDRALLRPGRFDIEVDVRYKLIVKKIVRNSIYVLCVINFFIGTSSRLRRTQTNIRLVFKKNPLQRH